MGHSSFQHISHDAGGKPGTYAARSTQSTITPQLGHLIHDKNRVTLVPLALVILPGELVYLNAVTANIFPNTLVLCMRVLTRALLTFVAVVRVLITYI